MQTDAAAPSPVPAPGVRGIVDPDPSPGGQYRLNPTSIPHRSHGSVILSPLQSPPPRAADTCPGRPLPPLRLCVWGGGRAPRRSSPSLHISTGADGSASPEGGANDAIDPAGAAPILTHIVVWSVGSCPAGPSGPPAPPTSSAERANLPPPFSKMGTRVGLTQVEALLDTTKMTDLFPRRHCSAGITSPRS